MPLVTITEVERLLPADADVRFFLDKPQTGDDLDISPIELVGWVAAPLGVEKIQVWQGTRLLRTLPIAVPRPDVQAAFSDVPLASGFWGLLGVVNLAPTFQLVIKATLPDGESVDLLAIRGRRSRLPATFQPVLQPALVTSLGRTGTTWLMRLLSRHPAIVAYDAYPYELRYAMYWLHVARVVAEPANHLESAGLESFHRDIRTIGHNPFFTAPLTDVAELRSWFGNVYTPGVVDFCLQNIESFYQQLARVQRQQHVVYFAEKFQPDELPNIAWGAYERPRELILVRDFRDMVASIFAFNDKRGTVGFGRAGFATDSDYVVEKLARGAMRLAEAWRSRKWIARLVKYEDLVEAPQETMSGILEYLGLAYDEKTVTELIGRARDDDDALDAHRTAPDAGSSIGRWRRDLDPALQDVCRQQFGGALEEFGYSLT